MKRIIIGLCVLRDLALTVVAQSHLDLCLPRRFARVIPWRVLIASVSSLVVFLSWTAGDARAAPAAWDGGAGADTTWQNALNWNPDGVPDGTSDVTFTNTGIPVFGIIIRLNSAASANSITISTIRALTLEGPGRSLVLTSGNFTRQDVSGIEADVTIDALVSMASNGVWDVSGSGAVTVSGLGQTGGTRSLNKTGNGFLEIQQPTYQGPTSVSQGTLRLDGFLTGAITVASGATLQISGSSGFPAMKLSGTGVAGLGALRQISGQTSTGLVTLNTDGVRISCDSGTLILGSGITDGASSFSWTKGGAGTISLFGASSYDGDTIIDQGTLFSFESSLGSGNVIVNPGGTFDTGVVNSKPIFLAGALARGNIFSVVTLTGSATFNVPNAADLLSISGTITDNGNGFGVTKMGAGTAELLGTNNFSGSVTVASGTLRLTMPIPSGAATTVQSGGTLELKGNLTINRPLQISGNGAGGAGALTSAGVLGSSTWSGPITLLADASIGAASDVSSGIPSTLTLAGPVTGSFTLTKVGSGTLRLANNSNSFASLMIAVGSLQLPSPAGAPVTVMEGASLSVSGNSVFNDPLTLISTSFLNFAELASDSGENAWTGPITFQGQNNSLNVTAGRLTISGTISGGLSFLRKLGPGEAVLAGSNSYLAMGTDVIEGILTVQSDGALPAPGGGAPFHPVTVFPGGTLQLKNNITVSSDKQFGLRGSGASGQGALFNGQGNNTFAGRVELESDTSIGAAAGTTLTLLGPIGDGDPTFDPPRALVKVGPGTLVLTRADSVYRGGTFINGGILSVASDAFLAGPADQVNFNNGGKLLITANTSTARTFNLNSGSIQVSNGVTLSYDGATVTGGFLRGPGTHAIAGGACNFSGVTALAGANISQNGPLFLNNFTNSGAFNNNSALTWDGGYNTAAGHLTVNSTLNTSGFENDGTLTVSNAATLSNSGNNLVSGGGFILAVNSGGTIQLNGSSLDLHGALAVNNGTISGTTNVYYGSVAKGTGNYGTVNVLDGGTYAPGTSPGVVTAASVNFDNAPFSSGGPKLMIELGGTTPGTGAGHHDQVNVTGSASLGGTLDLVPFNGFVPVAGDKFVVMTYASASGTFATVTGTTPAPGLTYSPVYSATNLTILTTTTGEKTWAVDASGNASVGANWTGGIAPGGIGDSATFSTIITAPRIVTLDADTTVGTLKFDSPVSYTIAGPHTLTLQAAGNNAATVNVLNTHGNGAQTISAPVTLSSDLSIVQNSSGTLRLAGPLDDSTSRTITKSGSGSLEIAAQPNLGAGTATNVSAGTLRFAAASGSPTLGTGVQVNVSGSAVLELAGSLSALAAGVNRANVNNNSSAAVGILVTGTNQVVGAIDGSGTTKVNAGSDLKANRIIQGALVIGGTASSPGLMTIAASDVSGGPLGQSSGLAFAGSLTSSGPFGAGGISFANLNSGVVSELTSLSPSGSVGGGYSSSVPEPSTLLLVLVAIAGLAGPRAALRIRARRNAY